MKHPKCRLCGHEHALGAPHVFADSPKADAEPLARKAAVPTPALLGNADLSVALIEGVQAMRDGDALPSVPSAADITALLQDYNRLKAKEEERRALKAAKMRKYRAGREGK